MVSGRRRLPDLEVCVDERIVASTTFVASAGPYVVAFSTVLPDHGVELHSSYTGHRDAEHTVVTRLFLAPGGAPHPAVTEHLPSDEFPVSVVRRRCLYDHLSGLQDQLTGHFAAAVRVELADRDVRAVEA